MVIAQTEHVSVRKDGKVWTVPQWIKMHYNVCQIVQDMEHSIWIRKRATARQNGAATTVRKVNGSMRDNFCF